MYVLPVFLSLAWLPASTYAADCGLSGTVIVKYDASAGDSPDCLGQRELQGWHRANWPRDQPQNNSILFKNEKDPSGRSAAHVHKDADFTRSEYHSLNKATKVDTTYYIGYRVSFENVDQQTIAFQWKDHHGAPGFTSVWSKQLTMCQIYNFGIVINTSKMNGFIQLYFDGKMATLTNPSTRETTQKVPGDFFPGRADPKFGMYDGKNFKVCDSYIYNGVIGTQLADIASVIGIGLENLEAQWCSGPAFRRTNNMAEGIRP